MKLKKTTYAIAAILAAYVIGFIIFFLLFIGSIEHYISLL